uniref:Uncharacterized protein n=1 Tax=Anguilla anguilla TaxID=7936 RepID=A0A0E9VFC3_ANGAN
MGVCGRKAKDSLRGHHTALETELAVSPQL